MLKAVVLTLFPEMFPGSLGHSLAGKALDEGKWSLDVLNIRDFAEDKHQSVDERPYGGGTGMVMRADILGRAIEAAREKLPDARRIYLSPRGAHFSQPMAAELCDAPLILLCGRFEGVDQRILDHYGFAEVSIGDYILSGGELGAQVILDACIRLIPGVIGKESVHDEESFGIHENNAGLLEYPHYTRPPCWKGLDVPEVLLSGNHAQIQHWRQGQAEALTQQRRPDLWSKYNK